MSTTDPSTYGSFANELKNYARLQQRRFFKSEGKKDPGNCPVKFAPDSGQSVGSREKCTPRAPPCCRKRPKNPKCAESYPPPCPCPCPCPPPPPKAPPPKICYRKCPPPPKPPKLPKWPKIPAPPPPPPLPKIPRLPKCPKPCPPPIPPPLPRCPPPPSCPECPPQRVCPPPPPCEPCPCPPPCPPPCCPPPPPCPTCPPPIPCPKPLPCPLPPPKVCPPCPPCAACPKPPPCPPPPPCCPCPCPKPPPPCPCPKPCPPCPQMSHPVACPKDVPSCPKCETRGGKSEKMFHKRKMSNYRGCPWHSINRKLHIRSVLIGKHPKPKQPNCKTVEDIRKADKGFCAKICGTRGEMSEEGFPKRTMSTYHGSSWHLTSRRLHVHSALMGKSSKPKQPSKCEKTEEICKAELGKKSCVKTCDKISECGQKRPVCQEKKPQKKKKKKKKKKDVCPDSCIPINKCYQPRVPSSAKMDYAPAKCPKPKFVSPKPCPDIPHEADDTCTNTRSASTPVDEVCIPQPLPKAPSDPVILCPCPPPPKLHPGPCPCYAFSKELTQAVPFPPCPQKEKYVCCKDSFYCIRDRTCKVDKPCEKSKKRRDKKNKKP